MILTLTFLTLFLFLVFLTFLPTNFNIIHLPLLSLIVTGLTFFLSCLLLLQFKNLPFPFILKYTLHIKYVNLNLLFGLDGISVLFFILSSFLIFLCVLFIYQEKAFFKEYIFSLILLEFLLLLVFTVLDLFFFYIFFEAILIPMFFIVGIWGSRDRKVRANYLLFFYTLICSLFMLSGLLYIYVVKGTLNYETLKYHTIFTPSEQKFLWLSFFFSFASKIPMFPFHIWLPEAHVEASTVGSVLLAGILLKLGVYGFIRFNLVLFPDASLFFYPLIYLLALIGIISASLTAIRQSDLKRIIAYSSIAHMNLIVLGLFSFTLEGLQGAIFQSISHGFVASALFFLIGILYNRYHSRSILYYGGLVHIMPLYAFFFLFFTLANIGFPGTSNFIGEFLLLLSVFYQNIFSCILATTGVIFSGIYSLWLYNRIIFGSLSLNNTLYSNNDLNLNESLILFSLSSLTLFMGIYPEFFLMFLKTPLLIINSLYYYV